MCIVIYVNHARNESKNSADNYLPPHIGRFTNIGPLLLPMVTFNWGLVITLQLHEHLEIRIGIFRV